MEYIKIFAIEDIFIWLGNIFLHFNDTRNDYLYYPIVLVIRQIARRPLLRFLLLFDIFTNFSILLNIDQKV